MASLAIGFVIGQQFLVEDFISTVDEFLTKSVDFIEQTELVSIIEKLEPGKRLGMDIGNLLFIFSMAEKPIEGKEDCYNVDLQIEGLTKDDFEKMTACSFLEGNQIKWKLTDIS